MKLAVFGATGKTGRILVEQALAAGHTVVAFARTPSKLDVDDERLRIVQGDIQDAAAVATAVAGADAVISVLGPTSNTPDYQISKGTANILSAMQQHGVGRLVISAGAGVGDPRDKPGLFDKFIKVLLQLFSRHVVADMARVVALVRASDLKWTVVRAPMLTDNPRGAEVRVGYLGQGVGPRLARADLAAFMLAQVDDDTYLRQAPVISN